MGADPADYSFAAESSTPYNVEFRVADVPMPGDYNQNGVVDAADYVVWRNGLGTTYTPAGFDTWRSTSAESPVLNHCQMLQCLSQQTGCCLYLQRLYSAGNGIDLVACTITP